MQKTKNKTNSKNTLEEIKKTSKRAKLEKEK